MTGSEQILRARRNLRVAISHGDIDFDCRLLLMGDRYRQVVRAYQEVVHRFERSDGPDPLYAWLTSSSEIGQFYEVRREGGLVSVRLHDAVFSPPPSATDLHLVLKMATGRQVRLQHPLPLSRLRALGCLLPMLLGEQPSQPIEARLPASLDVADGIWAAQLLACLRETGCLEEGAARPNRFASSGREPRVTLLGHTSLLFQSARSAVVTDPILAVHGGQPGSTSDVARLRLGAICCTHSHWDHCHPPTLLWFEKSTPVLIPKVREPSAFNPPIVPMLALMGFTDIREVEPWRPVRIDDIEVIPVPFHGEQDEPGAVIDHYTYVLRSDGLAVYGGVDSFHDTFGQMEPVLERVRAEYAPRIAFLPASEMRFSYRHGGVNGFCRYLDGDLLGQSFQYTAGPLEAAKLAAQVGAERVVPYALFTFSPRERPANAVRFGAALQGLGLSERFYPMVPLETTVVAGGDSLMARIHRRGRVIRFRVGGVFSAIERRLEGRRWYRLLRRGLAELLPRPLSHHH